jgi:tetratricopeptide (TPR) repeat protein
MDKQNLIKLGTLEERYRLNPYLPDIALELIKFLTTNIEMVERFVELGKVLVEKFPRNIKIRYTIFEYFQLLDDQLKKNPDERLTKIVYTKTNISTPAKRDIPELTPEDTTELRMKLLIMREVKQDDKAISEIEKFEEEFGISSQSIMMRADYHKTHNNIDAVNALKPKLAGVEDEFKYSALAYLEILTTDQKLKSSDVAMQMILKSIQEYPDNIFAFNILFMYCQQFFPKPDILRDILVETLKKDRPIDILSHLLTLFIRFTIFFPNASIFEKLIKLAHPLDVPVIQVLSALCLHFDDYGLARYISESWSNKISSFSPEFAVYVSGVAKQLAERCKSGIGLKPIKKEEMVQLKEGLHMELVSASIGSLKRYTTTNPNDAKSHLQLALLMQEFGMESSKEHFEKAFKLDPKNQIAKLNLALISTQEGDNIAAYSKFRDIVDDKMVEPGLTVEALIQASEIAIKFGWIEEAEGYLAAAKAILPFDQRVTLKLAKIYLKEAKIIGSEFALDKAREQLMIAVEKNPGNIEASYYLSHVHYLRREYLLAIRSFIKSSAANNPFEILSNFWVSRSYHQLYKNLLFSSDEYLDSAIMFAEKLTGISDKVPMVIDYLLHLYEEAKETEKAEKLLATKPKTDIKINIKKRCKNPGEVKVLSVYAPQMVKQNELNGTPKRYFSIGSIGRIEVSYLPGKGSFEITGNLGDSFLNSINVAYKFFLRYLTSKGLMPREDRVMHIDVPGWLPKYDGPSAGLPIAIAMISAYTGKPLPETVTMTGEISSMGRVMPVGGIKEKIEATHEKGITTVFIPKDNKWDHLDMLLKRAGHPEDFVPLPNVIDVEFIDDVVDFIGIGIDKKE